jgi:MATE family multidrug resistance protein
VPSPLAAETDAINAKTVFLLAAPAVVNSLLQTMVFVVDRAVLGHFDATAIAAMQTAGPLTWSFFSVFGAFSVGTLAVVGRAIGAKDHRAATRAARASIVLALALGLFVAAVGTLFARPMVEAFGSAAGPAVRDVSVRYLQAFFPAMPAFFVGLVGISALQAAGDTRTPLAIGVATNVVNMIANWALVFGHLGLPRMGATGSALGSVIAGCLEAALALIALSRIDAKVSLRAKGDGPSLKLDPEAFAALLRVAYGSIGERVVYHAGYLAFVRFVTALGPDAMAANQALLAIESVSFLTADGFAVAAGALVAQQLGADDRKQATRAGWLVAAQCSVVLAACGLLFAAFPTQLVRLFVADARVVAIAAPVLRFAALAQVPMAIGVVLAQSVRGAGATREAFAVSLLGALVVRIAATWLFSRVLGLGLLGVWMGSTVDWVVRAVVYSARWKSGAPLR